MTANNEYFQNVAGFTYMETTVRKQNSTEEGIKARLNSGNAYYNSVHNFCLSVSCLKTYRLKYTKL
jgi:hypothetical protein